MIAARWRFLSSHRLRRRRRRTASHNTSTEIPVWRSSSGRGASSFSFMVYRLVCVAPEPGFQNSVRSVLFWRLTTLFRFEQTYIVIGRNSTSTGIISNPAVQFGGGCTVITRKSMLVETTIYVRYRQYCPVVAQLLVVTGSKRSTVPIAKERTNGILGEERK